MGASNLKVFDCMTSKIVVLQPSHTLQTVMERFLEYRLDIGCVLEEDGTLHGIFTKYTLYRLLLGGVPMNTSISPYIIREVVTVDANESIYKGRETLLKHQVAHAVVVDATGKVMGVIAKNALIQGFLLEAEQFSNQVTSLIETLEDAVVGIDTLHCVHTFNSSAERMFQLTREEVLGLPVDTLFQISSDMKSTLRNHNLQQPKKISLPAAVAVATYAPINFRNRSFGAIAVLKDLTAYEKVASELETTKKLEKTLESALEIAYDGIAIVDEHGRITMTNDALSTLYLLPREELLGTDASCSIPELGLKETLETGQERIGEIHEIKGKKCIITLMPIRQQGRQVGAIAKVMFRQLSHLKDVFRRLEHLESELTYYRGEYLRASTHGTALDHIITHNPEMEMLKKQAYLAGQSASTVLITGESGTGKELFAQAIHEISGRTGNFVKVNCAAIPEELLESEFFGYADGAFTGARKGGKPGKFEMADEGTLFLDEIGDMPLFLQAKLLRALQERSFERIGDTRTTQVNVRIIAATNHRLEELIAEGKFREDLYYRLNVIHLAITPLRERKEDLILLCEHLIHKLNRVLGKRVRGVAASTLQLLHHHQWPGNVRELENTLERAMNIGNSDWIEPAHLPPILLSRNRKKPFPTKTTVLSDQTSASDFAVLDKRYVIANTEKDLILKALQECSGNRTRAAMLLGISRTTLYQKMQKYQIEARSYFESRDLP